MQSISADAPMKKDRSVCFSLFKEFNALVEIIERLKGIMIMAPLEMYSPTELSANIREPI